MSSLKRKIAKRIISKKIERVQGFIKGLNFGNFEDAKFQTFTVQCV